MITRAHIRRQLRKDGGIMSAAPRQGYFLGGVTRAIGKAVGKVGNVVKEVTKSPIGKAAILGAGIYGLGGGKMLGGQGFKLGNLPGYLRAKNFLMGQPLGYKTANDAVARSPGFLSKFIPETTLGKVAAGGALATGAALALPSEEQKKVSFLNERGGNVEDYLRQYYKSYFQANWQEGWNQDEEDEFVAANTTEYSKGGRVGLYGGGDPEMMDETLSPLQIMQDQGIPFGTQVKKLDAGAQSVTKEGDHTLTASETNPMAELYQVYLNLLETDQIPKATTFEMFIEMVQQNQESQQARAMAAKGGRIKYGIGDLVKGRSKMVLKDFFNDEEEYAKGGRIGFATGSRDPKNMTTQELIAIVKEGYSTPEIFIELQKRLPEGIEELDLAEMGLEGDQAFKMDQDILSNYDPNKPTVDESFLYDLREKNPDIYDNYQRPKEWHGYLDKPDLKAEPKHLPVMAKGGRVGLKKGSKRQAFINLAKAGGSRKDFIDLANSFMGKKSPVKDPLKQLLIHEMMMSGALPSELNQGGRVGLKKGTKGKGLHGKTDKEVLEELYPTLFSDTTTSIEGSPKKKKYYKGKAQGGRIGKYGGGVMGIGTPGMRLPGIPRMAPDGLEYDMSQHGGFQPLGAKEGKDDVKANLAKNEFVMTADAVRGAGDGDIELGAQKMYDTMKRLENKVA